MEPQPIYENSECKIESNKRTQSKDDYIYANEETHGPQNKICNRTESKAKNYKGSRCFVLSAVCLGLICVLLVSGIIMMHIKNMAEREESNLRYRNVVIQSNQTTNMLQVKYNELTAEKDQLQGSLTFLIQERQDLETIVESLSNELKKKAPERVKANGWHWYFISSEEKSWSDSRQFCRDHGGDLVIINSEEEQMFITSLIKDYVWIGLSDIKKEGNMTWVDNSPLMKGHAQKRQKSLSSEEAKKHPFE
ncbi:C-type lectin domain family 4 member F-like isoform X2 [Myxocyprinus asiaticus]|uniref:C-type lectin domain family 4 member F-like isoform X2 n=1 Tax=Myxocyprinus asiaticus TaxID=70543 RepID=UPI00222376AB|nr:C-type lectin domain family 4 member F-like isoform X2 [Myxocyprinus asiaticus]